MPFFMLGAEYSLEFFKSSWYLFFVFLVVIGSIDSYFFLNWNMFSLLENENWDELVNYLENRIYNRKKIYLYLIKILGNTYLLKSDMNGILKLEKFLQKEKPTLLKKIVIPLSVPRFIDGNPEKLEDFFGKFINTDGVKKAEWVKFLYSFSLLLNNKKDEAALSLHSMCEAKNSAILTLLVIYSLNPYFENGKDERYLCVEKKKDELRSRFSKQKMELEMDRINDNVLALVLDKFSKEAIDWLYKE
jgi:hypothetical protein